MATRRTAMKAGGLGIALMACVAAAFVALRVHNSRQTRADYPLRFDSLSHDFGSIKWKEIQSATFGFTNVSGRTVQISAADAGCACTQPELSAQTFRPGEHGTLTVRFNPFGYSGPIEKTAQIHLQGFQGEQTVRFRADVNSLLRIEPQTVEFGTMSPSAIAKQMVTLTNTSGQSIKLRQQSGSIYAELRNPVALASGQSVQMQFQLEQPPVGDLHEVLSVHTSLADYPLIEIPYHAQVECKWPLSRPDFYIGFVNKGTHPTAQVTLKGLKSTQVLAAYVDMIGAFAKASYVPDSDGTKVTLALDLTHVPPGTLGGRVILRTIDQSQFFLSIPITGVVQDPNKSSCCSK